MTGLIDPIPATSPNWHPIATGPRDGTRVMLFYPVLTEKIQIGRFISSETFEYGRSVHKNEGWFAHVASWPWKGPEPSHWMPLPAEPEVDNRKVIERAFYEGLRPESKQ